MFHELNDEQLGLVTGMCTFEVYEPGAIFHRQNQILDKLYIIEDGLVAIIVEPGPLSQRQLQAACNFETFGWSALIPPHQSTATVKAIERTRVLAFNRQDVINLCCVNPEVGCVLYRAIARVIADRLKSAFMQLLGVTSQD